MFRAPPRLIRGVPRARLFGALDRAATLTLTLVCAPPGSGKTTLVSDWVNARRDLGHLWFTLDERANTAGTLASALWSELAELTSLAPDGEHGMLGLGEALVGVDPPAADIVVVLDDAQELTDRTAWRAFDHLLSMTPPWLHWIVISRADPPIGVRRLQMNGRLAQVRAADLAADPAEAGELLSSLGCDLPDESVRQLCAWSEGWMAALCLAATARAADTAPGPAAHLASSEALVLDFLVEEVLDRLATADRNFLLRLSSADLVTPELAALLTGSRQAGARLQRLGRAGTFLLEADAEGRWYRFHSLMATLLRIRLQDEAPDELLDLTSRAARWYLEHGLDDLAERHALRAEHWQLVGMLRTRRCVRQLLRTGSISPDRHVALPARRAGFAGQDLLSAIDAMHRRDARAARALLEEPRPDDLDGDASLLAGLLSIELARWQGVDAGQEAADDQLRALVDGAEHLHGLAALTRLRAAERRLTAPGRVERDDLQRIVHGADTDWTRRDAAALLALVDAVHGRSADARRLLAGDRAARAGDAGGWLRLASAVVHAMRGEHEAVGRQVDVLMRSPTPRSALFEQSLAVIRAAHTGADGSTPALAAPSAGLLLAVALAAGVLEGIDERGRPWTVGGELERTLIGVRRLAPQASAEALSRAIGPWSTRTTSAQHPRSAVELQVALAVRDLRAEDPERAIARAETALDAAAEASIWAPFVQAPADLVELLLRHRWELIGRHISAVELFERLRPPARRHTEPLTERERAVLRYLPTLMSNTEIADELVMSVNTVKTHLKSIYRKLGVDRRRDALVRARQIELL